MSIVADLAGDGDGRGHETGSLARSNAPRVSLPGAARRHYASSSVCFEHRRREVVRVPDQDIRGRGDGLVGAPALEPLERDLGLDPVRASSIADSIRRAVLSWLSPPGILGDMTARRRAKRAEGRNQQLVRVLGVLRDLDRLGGTDLYELAAKWGATTRTIRRDLAALQEAGVPIAAEPNGRRVRWRTIYRDRMASGLTGLVDVSHYLALRLAMQQPGPARRTTTIFASLEDLSDRIEKALGPKDRAHLAAVERCFLHHERAAWRSAPPDIFWPLLDAITSSHLCRFTYQALYSKAPGDFTALPLRLFIHHGVAYALAWIPKYDRVLTLNLQRLRALRSLRTIASPPDGFDADRWADSAFGVWSGGPATTYRLRFSPAAAAYVRERVWHPSQVLHDHPDGAVDLELTCGASPEVTSWVASFRGEVEVLAPKNLRRDLADLGRWLASTYGAFPRVLRPTPRARGAAGASSR